MNKFKVGDKVKWIYNKEFYNKHGLFNKIFTITSIGIGEHSVTGFVGINISNSSYIFTTGNENSNNKWRTGEWSNWPPNYFELVESNEVIIEKDLGWGFE